MKRISFFLLFTFISISAHARIYIPVDQASEKPFPIAIADLVGSKGDDVANIIRNDLDLSGYFNVIDPHVFEVRAKQEGITLESIRFSYWNVLETQALVKGSVEAKRGEYDITLRLFDPSTPSLLVEKKYTVTKKNLRMAAHRFSDEIMAALTGIPGPFTTQITFTASDRKNTKNIYLMDFDGENMSRVTNMKESSFASSLSPNGNEIVFTSFQGGQANIYGIKSNGSHLQKLTSSRGSKITPTWSPDGNSILYSSAESGEADLYRMSSKGKNVKRIAAIPGIDLAPSFSPDGQEIVFASEQAGKLHLFKMPSTGGASTRLTYVGYQNDMPAWSPRADKIAFCGRDLGAFDIFIMNPDGSNIQRLTLGTGDNEHPRFSPDGRLITFSSTRHGGSAIYIMRTDGSNQRKVSKGNGILPSWGPRR
ncbi:MAG: Tol-Pal system beta propeller repeat protein TolB [Deltaproteobacteria bacterium CG11_big_fil_rev_8_21_14_0_20_42_23]|nr:MAG: Tol-Pal system beta propeller repeat protein TolB [Deltaproteobacteria bacterium CG11_big_fil_rev_8_21_14_0_20_42_23]PJC63380.1 MAG: Tol-Pal system beta propeller repeat protein TolB [Deltaproteobacteria bacterium CG_4_9_14_0_2_um_filter_42_21]